MNQLIKEEPVRPTGYGGEECAGAGYNIVLVRLMEWLDEYGFALLEKWNENLIQLIENSPSPTDDDFVEFKEYWIKAVREAANDRLSFLGKALKIHSNKIAVMRLQAELTKHNSIIDKIELCEKFFEGK